MIMHEEQSKTAPGPLALVQALVNTQYGHGRYAHVELTSPEQLRAWLVAHGLLADDTPVTEGDFRRVFQLREALRSLLRANNETEMLASQVDVLNRLSSNAPLTVRFHHDGLPTLELDIAGVDGTLARLLGIVFTAARRRSTILPRIVQGRGVRWQVAGVVSRRVRIDIGAQHTWRDKLFALFYILRHSLLAISSKISA